MLARVQNVHTQRMTLAKFGENSGIGLTKKGQNYLCPSWFRRWKKGDNTHTQTHTHTLFSGFVTIHATSLSWIFACKVARRRKRTSLYVGILFQFAREFNPEPWRSSPAALHHATTPTLPTFLCYRLHQRRLHSLGDGEAAWFGQIRWISTILWCRH